MERTGFRAAKAVTVTSLVGSDRRGFTFVEIILVLLLIGVSLLLVLPNINKGLQDREVRSSAMGLAAVARDLRRRAVLDGIPQLLVLYPQQNSYLVGRRREVQLPLEVMFASVEGGETIDRDTTKFYFFPNGSSLGGEIVLGDREGRTAYAVRFEGLTGRVAVARR
jgi:prepilin-type N-terminal cleavage/methylation domain-containing protein